MYANFYSGLISPYGVGGWGLGGLGWEGEKILFPCVSICIASLCLSMPDCDIDFALKWKSTRKPCKIPKNLWESFSI